MAIKNYIIPILAFLCVIGLLINGPITQDQNYHNFADERSILGIPNFLNVMTNLPFAIVGILGLWAVSNMEEKELKRIYFTLFTSFLLLLFGSGYYHLWPNNKTLVYDRIPITMILMSFFAFIIYDRINKRKGYIAFIVFNIIGIMSVIYWGISERMGYGDLRWYGMVQFFPIIAIPIILFQYRSSFKFWKEVILIFLFFGLAKLTEKFDREFYHALDNIISGHSLKHILMAAAGYEIIVLMRRRLSENAKKK